MRMAACLGMLGAFAPVAAAQDIPRCMPMRLPIAHIDDAPRPYSDFCSKNEGACVLTGPAILEWSPSLHRQLRTTNEDVNASIRFVPDPENSGLEEVWDFPRQGEGDCEDFALEKRRRLVEAGLPSASMTCGIAFHQTRLFAHAVLLVETTAGTFVLDNLHDDVLCWDAVPYFYTARERPDGQWTRFQQP